jgi:hypothetical protein
MIVFGRGFWIFQMDDMFCLCENRRIRHEFSHFVIDAMVRSWNVQRVNPMMTRCESISTDPRLDFHGSAYPARVGLPPIPNSMTSSARRNLARAVLSDVRKGKKYRAPAD